MASSTNSPQQRMARARVGSLPSTRLGSRSPSGNVHMCTTDNAINVKKANALGPGAIVLQAACEGSTTLECDNLDPHASLTIATCVMAVDFLSGQPRPHFLIVHCQPWPDEVVRTVCMAVSRQPQPSAIGLGPQRTTGLHVSSWSRLYH
ncbi:hypothetical protein N7519_009324 [Penicillium mononematosum]|uniref:uncharacterized protein n=1 Tax=Penicillium mononematosum TaxID=268346 RepID=UPI002547AD7A|nr:uncharacterized protein N7519_009324 [Penicillium mononematosum]KAJ6178863.1 hypothetical protein N7519_009324 [Penicillium mononematosum]